MVIARGAIGEWKVTPFRFSLTFVVHHEPHEAKLLPLQSMQTTGRRHRHHHRRVTQ